MLQVRDHSTHCQLRSSRSPLRSRLRAGTFPRIVRINIALINVRGSGWRQQLHDRGARAGMNAETIPLWLALLIQLGLGLAVFRANPKNYSNQSFLIVSLFISAWLLSLQFAFNAAHANRPSSGFVTHRRQRNPHHQRIQPAQVSDRLSRQRMARNRQTFRASGAAEHRRHIALCYTHFFLKHAQLRGGQMQNSLIPQPVYGPLLPLYVAFFGGAVLFVIVLYVKSTICGAAACRRWNCSLSPPAEWRWCY